MAMPGRDAEVLLFYDGFERQAVDGIAPKLYQDVRRAARFAYKTARRQQTRTGFYTWFLMLCEALERAGCRLRINDFAAARRSPQMPIGAAGYASVLDKLEGLSNPRLIGPGLFASPLELPNLFDDPRNVSYLQTCAWGAKMFAPWYGDHQRNWFGGFDVKNFADARSHTKALDVLIYDKIYFCRAHFYEETIARFRSLLDTQGLRHATIRYGSYNNSDYHRLVKSSRCMAFFAHSETQGMAYQECLAMNVPIFAWDEGIWPNPIAAQISAEPVTCTSVPYFDDRCGVRFSIKTMERDWINFLDRLNREQFTPRQFIATELTLEKSAELYLDAYAEAGLHARTTAKPSELLKV